MPTFCAWRTYVIAMPLGSAGAHCLPATFFYRRATQRTLCTLRFYPYRTRTLCSLPRYTPTTTISTHLPTPHLTPPPVPPAHCHTPCLTCPSSSLPCKGIAQSRQQHGIHTAPSFRRHQTRMLLPAKRRGISTAAPGRRRRAWAGGRTAWRGGGGAGARAGRASPASRQWRPGSASNSCIDNLPTASDSNRAYYSKRAARKMTRHQYSANI